MTIPTWFPRFSDQIVAAYEAGHLTFDDASEIFANTCGTHPGMIVMGERLESVGDAALVIGMRALVDAAPVFGTDKIAAAIAPYIQAGKARGHVMIAAYRAADGSMSARQVERIVYEEIAALTARERHLVTA
ncbi:hypothetical protein UFOVP1619_26 [uncultured Caudovirales phage]|uniref:Uncharacterized protein n=1 Tax=uncultured Caudovirales phage TaxID=2100421 RepID=A0A6J5SVR2_9CAUD|nr:hypothetical protein UFOVP1619_26 [uncultured Caudovirales phage]